jgi:YVTN family beta-propeller protein
MLQMPRLCSRFPAAVVVGLGLTLTAAAVDLPGARTDGSILLPNQWSLRPVGKQVPLGDFPVNVAVHPGGKFAAVLHCGHGQHEVVSVALPSGKVVSRVSLEESFYGLTFSPDGSRLFASGAGAEVVHRFTFRDGLFSEALPLGLRDAKERGVPSGMVASADGRWLYAAELFGMAVTALDLETGRPAWSLSLAPGAVATDLSQTQVSANSDLAATEKRDAAHREQIAPDAPWPYACALDDARQRLYVSLWGRAEVAVIDLRTRAVTARWATEEHPNEMRLARGGKVLYVANANRNTVSVLDTETGRALETLSAALHPDDPPGSTPNSLALSANEEFLFVANAGNNCVAVFEIEEVGKSKALGFIPVGWYPTSVRLTPDGKHLLVANGKGISSKANRHGPQPGRDLPSGLREYIGGLFRGTLSVIPLPDGDAKFAAQMRTWTEQTMKCSPAPARPEVSAKRGKQNPIPSTVGGKSPIQHVIYIIKENRTYDQVLGDVPEGNGDPGLCLFPEAVSPNHHKLAREFVLLDNFYVEAEVSADGHEWSMGGYATDFVEKTWPLSYGHNARGKYPYPSEGTFPIAAPPNAYLWDRAKAAGVTYRSYGEFVENPEKEGQPARALVPALEGNFDPWFQSFDMDYPDAKRADRFISELHRFEKEGAMPRLQIVRLPNDHTSGTSVGKPTPRAFMADNDLAFGRVVEAVSRSKFWPTTAIFVLEDDAQNGPDHVDAHRSIAFVISPYTKRKFRDSTMYSTCSMLRTIELILGLKPLSQFDAAAAPMFHSFQPKADLRPYLHLPVTVDLQERNLAGAWGDDESAKMNFQKEDAADDLLLNEIVWRSVKGPDSPMPAPVRAAFVRVTEDDDEDDR